MSDIVNAKVNGSLRCPGGVPKPMGVTTGLSRALTFLALACMVLLFWIWPFPHTIAARNISIGLGALSGLIWLFLARHHIRVSGYWPHLLLLGVPCWLVVLYLFFPQDPQFQYKELTGTWARVVGLIIFGYCLGKILATEPRKMKYLYLAITAVPLITPIAYWWLLHSGSTQSFIFFFYKSKIAGAYYVVYACLMSYATLVFLASEKSNQGRYSRYWAVFSYVLILIGFLDCIFLQSLNGIIAAGTAGIWALAILLYRMFKSKRIGFQTNSLGVLILASFIVIAVNGYMIYGDTDKLKNLFTDIATAIDIDKNQTWRRDDATRLIPDPKNSHGITLNVSSYERISWFLKSIQIIKSHPLGTGDPYCSFGRFMRSEYPGSIVQQSHSGWLDFAMGAGIPALALVWLALGVTCWHAKKSTNQPNLKLARLVAIFMLLGMASMYWYAELADRDYIEEYFFLIAIFGAMFGDNLVQKCINIQQYQFHDLKKSTNFTRI